jgi:hypothetical protein
MTSRIEIARIRVEKTKRGLVVVATAGFLTVMLLARASHAGSAGVATSTSQAGSSTSTATSSDDLGSSSSGSFGPATATPQVQTSVS